MQGALIGPFRVLNGHLNQTSGEREFILIPFWNLDVHLLPGTCANICLFGNYLFLYCIVLFFLFFFLVLFVYGTLKLYCRCWTSQAYRLLLLCKWSFENLSSCVPHDGRLLVNLVTVTVDRARPESDASRYTWTVPVCKFSLFRWRKNSRTSCLEFLRSRYFLLEINRTILLLLQPWLAVWIEWLWLPQTYVTCFTKSYLIRRLRIVLVTLDSPAYQCNGANVTLIAVSALDRTSIFRKMGQTLRQHSPSSVHIRTYFIGDVSEWK